MTRRSFTPRCHYTKTRYQTLIKIRLTTDILTKYSKYFSPSKCYKIFPIKTQVTLRNQIKEKSRYPKYVWLLWHQIATVTLRETESEATAGEGDFGRFPEQKNSAAASFYYFLSILSSDFLCLGSLYQWKDLPGYITVCGGTPFIQSRTEKNPKSAEDVTLLTHLEKIILC